MDYKVIFDNLLLLKKAGDRIFYEKGSLGDKLNGISDLMGALASFTDILTQINKPGVPDVIADVVLQFEMLNEQYRLLSEFHTVSGSIAAASEMNSVRMRNKLDCLLNEGSELKKRREEIENNAGELAFSLLDYYAEAMRLDEYERVFICAAEAESFIAGDYLGKTGLNIPVGYISQNGEYMLAERWIESVQSASLTEKDAVILVSMRDLRLWDRKSLSDSGISNVLELNIFDNRDYDYYSRLPEKLVPLELKWWYEKVTGDELDYEHPITYDQKIQWMKLFDNDKRKTLLADKYLVREWVKERIGEKYLIPLLGVYDCFDDINFRDLPDSFVLKYNHGSGFNLLVDNKAEVDMSKAKAQFDRWRVENYAYYTGFELHYRDIRPKIVAEEKLVSADGEDLKDYKLFVFDGAVKFIQVDFDRYTDHKRNLYTPDWEYMNCSIGYKTDPKRIIPRPGCLKELIELAEKLGEGFAHVRVDFYVVEDRIFFGEMTFTHGSGIERFSPKEFGVTVGGWIDLTKCVT